MPTSRDSPACRTASGGATGDPVEAFGRWNLAWVRACADTMLLFMWNVTSDPCEVLDLQRREWSIQRIADFVTAAVLATPDA